MSFCEHCEGQRFDRARVLRTLRQLHKELRATDRCAGEAVSAAARMLDIAREYPAVRNGGADLATARDGDSPDLADARQSFARFAGKSANRAEWHPDANARYWRDEYERAADVLAKEGN